MDCASSIRSTFKALVRGIDASLVIEVTPLVEWYFYRCQKISRYVKTPIPGYTQRSSRGNRFEQKSSSELSLN